MFERFRTAKKAETLEWHVYEIAKLERLREVYEVAGQREMVLAVNSELVSHASRGLTLLRKLEEGALRPDADLSNVRSYLTANAYLPGIPRPAVDSASSEEVERLYDLYRLKHCA